jgi:hypothetical protein
VTAGSIMRGVLAAAILLLMLAGPGCGYRRPAMTRPQGIVTLDGEPVAAASVMLVPLEPGRPVAAVSDEAGRLVFSTYGSNDGVPPGRYKAVVSKLVPTKKAARKLDAARGRKAEADDQAEEAMVELDDDDYENLLPARYATAATTDLVVMVDRRTRQIALALETESEAGLTTKPPGTLRRFRTGPQ